MLALGDFVGETISSAPGTGNFLFSGTAISTAPYDTWNGFFGTTGPRAVFYVAKSAAKKEMGYGYHDPSLNSGSGGIVRFAGGVIRGSSGQGTLVNFDTGPVDVYVDLHSHAQCEFGVSGRMVPSTVFEDFIGTGGSRFATNSANGGSAGLSGVSSGGVQGVMALGTGTSNATSGQGYCVLNSSNTAADTILFVGAGILKFETILKIPVGNVAGTPDTFDVRIGFQSSPVADSNNGVWMQYGQTIDGLNGSTGKIGLVAMNSATPTRGDSGFALDTAAFHKYGIEIRHDGSRADFFVDDAWIGALTSGLPTLSTSKMFGAGVGITRVSGNTALTNRQVLIDTFGVDYYPTSARA